MNKDFNSLNDDLKRVLEKDQTQQRKQKNWQNFQRKKEDTRRKNKQSKNVEKPVYRDRARERREGCLVAREHKSKIDPQNLSQEAKNIPENLDSGLSHYAESSRQITPLKGFEEVGDNEELPIDSLNQVAYDSEADKSKDEGIYQPSAFRAQNLHFQAMEQIESLGETSDEDIFADIGKNYKRKLSDINSETGSKTKRRKRYKKKKSKKQRKKRKS
eukprot:snap_masked-scaffold_18-processed-gene-4.8-mRNA-1 protein AED:0.99 eAED:1.00 QI:0/-1/0/1/-1/1/1/0/215